MPSTQSYFFVFTRFGESPEDYPTTDLYRVLLETKKISYIAWGEETAPSTGRLHHQGFVKFSKRTTEFSVRREMSCYAAVLRGRLQDNEDYCSKEGTLQELGTKPAQGTRTDINSYCERVRAGELSVDDILTIDPQAFHSYGRTLQATEDLANRQKMRTWMTEGLWLYGPTGCGKSRRALSGFSPDSHYILNLDDKGWWEGYQGQEYVILDDFRGQLAYSSLLRLVDRYPHTVPRRCRQPAPFLAVKLIVTSALPPAGVYHNLAEKDSLAQLERRFTIECMGELPAVELEQFA